ncbi:hypothetical protein WN48_01163 [Eufriesea mexicana]|nr:hypothetical protein WN48_01163 [Eufriesea mexicana]
MLPVAEFPGPTSKSSRSFARAKLNDNDVISFPEGSGTRGGKNEEEEIVWRAWMKIEAERFDSSVKLDDAMTDCTKVAQAGKGDRQIGGLSYLVVRRRRTDDDQRPPGHAKTGLEEKGKTKIEGRTDGHWINKGQ